MRQPIAICLLAAALLVRPAAADDDPLRPVQVETEGVPPVPTELFQRLRQYRSVRWAEFSGWAPSGKGILARTRFGNAAQLHRVYEPGGRREQVTFFDEPVHGGFIPGSKDDALLLVMSRGGNENNQVYFFDPPTSRATLLTDGQSRNNLGPILDDGSRMILSSNRRNGRDTDLYVAEPRQSNDMKMVWQTDGEYWYAADWSRDAKTLLLGRYVSVNESYAALLDVDSGKRDDLPLPGEGKVAIGSMAFARDGKSVYLATDGGSEYLRLARMDLQTRRFEWLTDDIDWDVSGLAVDRQGRTVAFTVNEDGASRLFLLREGQREPLELPLCIVGDLEFSPDGQHLGFTLFRPDAPGDAWSISLSDKKLTRWTYSEVGGLQPDLFVQPERITFPSFDDRKIPAYYFRPKQASPANKVPVLITIHGGPESQYRPYLSSSVQYYVNELGLAVIAPNVRGSRGYGKSYLKLDNGKLRENSVRDIGALLDWIATQPELDASRVAVSGGSYGGYMVLASLAHYGDRLKAGIDVVGIANFITFLENTAEYRRDLRRAEYGDGRDPEMRAAFEKINPTALADKIRSALLVAHGKNDPRVPFSEAQQIADKVRGHGRPVWTVYAENEGHGFGKKANSDYLQAVRVMFLRKHLSLNER